MKVVEIQNKMIIADSICYLENEAEMIFIHMTDGSSFRLIFKSVHNASEYFAGFKEFLCSEFPGLFVISYGLFECCLIEEEN